MKIEKIIKLMIVYQVLGRKEIIKQKLASLSGTPLI